MSLEKVKNYLLQHPEIAKIIFRILNCLNLTNSIKGKKNNNLAVGAALIKKTKISVYGRDNTIIVDDFSILNHCSIDIYGNRNEIHISSLCNLNNLSICIEDDNNRVTLETHVSVCGATEIACIEGTSITIGEECLFSSNIHFRTGDSHSITDLQGNRINPSKSILVGRHVWFGRNVMVLKGTNIFDDSVVAAGAICTENIKDNCSNSIIAGVPAKVIKKGISWGRKRI